MAIGRTLRKLYSPVQRRLDAHLDRSAVRYVSEARKFLSHSGPIPPEDNSWSQLFTPMGQIKKRALDVGASVVGMFILFPVSVVIAPLIKLSSEGPVLFAQEREGIGGRPIRIVKFRTMFDGAERYGLRHFRPERINWKPNDDERTISIGGFELGRYMRKYAIDEFPQFVLLLTGRMSFVGPRAKPANELDSAGNLYNWRMHRRKLATGLIPVALTLKGGYPSNQEMVELEMYYIAKWSPAMNFRMALRGLLVLAAGRHK